MNSFSRTLFHGADNINIKCTARPCNIETIKRWRHLNPWAHENHLWNIYKFSCPTENTMSNHYIDQCINANSSFNVEAGGTYRNHCAALTMYHPQAHSSAEQHRKTRLVDSCNVPNTGPPPAVSLPPSSRVNVTGVGRSGKLLPAFASIVNFTQSRCLFQCWPRGEQPIGHQNSCCLSLLLPSVHCTYTARTLRLTRQWLYHLLQRDM
jgi:hypothetical protein